MLSFYFFFDEFYFQIVNVLFSFALCVVLDYAEYTYKWVLIWSIRMLKYFCFWETENIMIFKVDNKFKCKIFISNALERCSWCHSGIGKSSVQSHPIRPTFSFECSKSFYGSQLSQPFYWFQLPQPFYWFQLSQPFYWFQLSQPFYWFQLA